MSKSKIYCVSIVLMLFVHISSSACGLWEYPPGEYLLYRVYNPEENIDVDYRITQLEKSDDPEVVRYMKLARSCEEIRKKQNAKWYYPSKNDEVIGTLEEIMNEALEYKGSRLKDRYALQAARAMFSLGRFKEMKKWWKEIKTEIADGPIKTSIEGYVAGAMFRTGEEQKALEYYSRIGDLSSIIFCLKKEGEYTGDRSILEYASIHCPDNPHIAEILQRYITRIEGGWTESEKDKGKAAECYEICIRAAEGSTKPAVWLYSAAFLKNLMGQPYVASNILDRAEKCRTTVFLQESIKVLRILVDANISTYNKTYEAELLRDLQWLDQKICSNITDEVIKNTQELYLLKYGESYYYWNDMMRKIILGTVVARMVEAGKTPLGLLLANYADNRLLSLVNQVKTWNMDEVVSLKAYRQYGKYFNQVDYSNHYFRMLDNIDIPSVLAYEQLLKNPSSSLEWFLYNKSYIDNDYLMDLIGTRYLRDCKYQNAAEYLALVSEGYQDRLNTKSYMRRHPFTYRLETGEIFKNYKLSFARKMVDYQTMISTCKDPDVVGEAMMRYGTGMRSSFEYCWALTHYGRSEYAPWFTEEDTVRKRRKADAYKSKGIQKLTHELGCDNITHYSPWRIDPIPSEKEVAEWGKESNVGELLIFKRDHHRI